MPPVARRGPSIGSGYSTTGTGTSSVVWGHWNDSVTNSTAGTCSACDNGTASAVIWQSWTITSDSTSSASFNNNAPVFQAWITNNVQTIQRVARPEESWRSRVESLMTPEEREEQERKRREREAARQVEREAEMKQREAAIFKAEKLLRSCLTAEQEAALNKHNYFTVKGGKTGTKYRIRRGRHINIEVLGAKGKAERKLCFAPRVDCPDADAMLCQKLMLELDEDAALKVAIKHSIGTGILHGRGDRIVPRARREEIIAEVIPIDRGRRAA